MDIKIRSPYVLYQMHSPICLFGHTTDRRTQAHTVLLFPNAFFMRLEMSDQCMHWLKCIAYCEVEWKHQNARNGAHVDENECKY